MGSPFDSCEVVLSGSWIPHLPENQGWLKLSARTGDGRWLGLARWSAEGNTPGFRLIAIDQASQTAFESERLAGCCTVLSLERHLFEFETWEGAKAALSLPSSERTDWHALAGPAAH